MDASIVLLSITIMVIIYWWFSRHDPRLPPCPCRPLPVVGHLLYLGTNFRPVMHKWQRQCGNIYSLYMGPSLVIVLNGYEAVKEVLIQNDKVTIDRPPMIFDRITKSPGTGNIFANGAVWKEQRAMTMNILHTLGVGRNILAERVNEIAASLNEDLASLKGEPTDINHIITTSVANVICSIIIGECFDHHDGEFVKMCELVNDISVKLNGTQILNYFPFLSNLPGDIFEFKKIQVGSEYIMNNFAAKYVNQKGVEEFNEHVLDNFIALYVLEMNKKKSTAQETTLNKQNLIRNIYDLFVAGMETTSTTLMWCILYMIRYPAVQQKVHEDIDNEIGTDRMVNFSDRNKLPYLNAVIAEIQRLSSIAPLSLPRLCTDTFTVGGYLIPKGASLLINLDSVLLHDKVWGLEPDMFRPERFIDGQGKLGYPDEFIPFSLGKRMCSGEALAKLELFVFFSNMVQRFRFVAADPDAPPPVEAVVGLISHPAPYLVRAQDRKLMANSGI